MYPPNLIGCCHECNNKKRTDWTAGGVRLFLHAYFDRFPDDAACIKASISWNGRRPMFSFRIVPQAAVSESLSKILAAHVERLQLLHWYSARAEEEFDDFEPIDQQLSIGDLRDLIRTRKIEKQRQRWGPLSWKAALWNAVIDDPDALEYMRLRLAGERIPDSVPREAQVG